jgi:hypothetical protein
MITSALFLAAALPQVEASSTPSVPPAGSLGWTAPSGKGVGFGLDFFGAASADTDVELDVSVLVPFSSLVALRMRPTLYDSSNPAGGWAMGGKLEVVFRSAVMMNFVRVYAGGGPAIFYGLSGPSARQVDGNWFAGDVNGNWFVGAEIFLASWFAVHWELGTSGGALSTGAGPYTSVGLMAYPF